MNKKPLSSLNHVQADEALKQKTLQAVLQQQHKASHKHAYEVIMITAAACICLIVFGLFQNRSTTAIKPATAVKTQTYYSYITMDINPSLELILDDQDIVQNVKTYNEDANVILSELSLKELPYEEAIRKIINQDQYQQYLNQDGFLQVTVYSKDKAKALDIEQQINNNLKQHLDETQYSCHDVDEQTHHEANDHHMSAGRYAYIEEILRNSDAYTLEQLNRMNMSEIRNIYYELIDYKDEPQNYGHHRGNCHRHGN